MKKLESFFWGIIAALGAYVIQFFLVRILLIVNPTEGNSYAGFFSVPAFILFAAFAEEIFKYLMLLRRIVRISSKKTFLANACLMGIGFFSVELLLILANSAMTSIQMMVEIAVLHIGTAVLMGYFIVATKKMPSFNSIVVPLVSAIALHFLFNFFVSKESIFSDYANILMLTVLIVLDLGLFRHLEKLLAQEPKPSYN